MICPMLQSIFATNGLTICTWRRATRQGRRHQSLGIFDFVDFQKQMVALIQNQSSETQSEFHAGDLSVMFIMSLAPLLTVSTNC
jgi:hypothetical protein